MRSLIEEGVELGALALLQDTRDRGPCGKVVVDEILISIGDGRLPLVWRGPLSDPSVHIHSRVKDEDVAGMQLGPLNLALADLGELELAAGIAESPQRLHAGNKGGLDLGLDIGLGSAKNLEELGQILISFGVDGDVGQPLALVVDSLTELPGLALLVRAGFRSVPLVHLLAVIEDEDIAAVKRGHMEEDFVDRNLRESVALNVEQSWLVLLGLDVVESRVDSSLKDPDGVVLEVGQEEGRLKSHHLAMLDRSTTKEVIELN